MTNDEFRLTNGGIACAAQALAPRVAQSFKIDRMHYSTFDVGRSTFDVQLFSVIRLAEV